MLLHFILKSILIYCADILRTFQSNDALSVRMLLNLMWLQQWKKSFLFSILTQLKMLRPFAGFMNVKRDKTLYDCTAWNQWKEEIGCAEFKTSRNNESSTWIWVIIYAEWKAFIDVHLTGSICNSCNYILFHVVIKISNTLWEHILTRWPHSCLVACWAFTSKIVFKKWNWQNQCQAQEHQETATSVGFLVKNL